MMPHFVQLHYLPKILLCCGSLAMAPSLLDRPLPPKSQELAFKLTLEHSFQVVEEHYATYATFSPDGQVLYGSGRPPLKGWRLDLKKLTFNLGAPHRQCALSQDGSIIITAHEDVTRLNILHRVSKGFVRVWDTKTSVLIKQFPLDCEIALCAALSPNGKQIAVGGNDRTVRVLEFPSGRLIRTLHPGPKSGVLSETDSNVGAVHFSPSGKQLLTQTQNDLQRFDLATGKELPLEGRRYHLTNVAFSADGKWIAVGASKPVPLEPGQKPPGPGNRYIFSVEKFGRVNRAYATHVVQLWEASTGKLAAELPCDDGVLWVLFHPDGKHLLTVNGAWGFRRDRVAYWDLTSKKRIRTWKVPPMMTYAAICPTGRRLATCHQDGKVRVWRLPPLGGKKR